MAALAADDTEDREDREDNDDLCESDAGTEGDAERPCWKVGDVGRTPVDGSSDGRPLGKTVLKSLMNKCEIPDGKMLVLTYFVNLEWALRVDEIRFGI